MRGAPALVVLLHAVFRRELAMLAHADGQAAACASCAEGPVAYADAGEDEDSRC